MTYLLLCWIYSDVTWAMMCNKQRSLTCSFDSFFGWTMNYTWNLRITGSMWIDSSAVIDGWWTPQIARFMGRHGAHLKPIGPRRAPCWPLNLAIRVNISTSSCHSGLFHQCFQSLNYKVFQLNALCELIESCFNLDTSALLRSVFTTPSEFMRSCRGLLALHDMTFGFGVCSS